jgi:CelD/BcsL family acetyltransferase involved in cellulose biosynthesis
VLSLAEFRTAADYVARLSKARRRSRSRRSKGLAERGTVSFRALQPEHPDYARILTRAMAYKKSWLARTGRVSLGLSMPGHAAFLAGIGKGPVLFELAVNGETIAAELGFLRNRHFYSYLGSFDWAWRDLSPGKAQMDLALEWLIAQGAEAYDLLAHRTSYKDSWSDTEIPLHGHVVEITTRGAIYARCWINTARPALKRAMASIPEEYRAGLQIMMKQDIPFLA